MLCLFTVLNSNKSYFFFVCLTLVVIRVTGRVNEAIHIRLHPNNINRDCGIEVPEAWMPTIKQHNNKRVVRQRTAEGTNQGNSRDRNEPIRAVEKQLITAEHHVL